MLDDYAQKYLKTHKPLERKPLINTGRIPMNIEKYPHDLDFSKNVGGTTYVVKSHFDTNASECFLMKVARLLDDGRNRLEQHDDFKYDDF